MSVVKGTFVYKVLCVYTPQQKKKWNEKRIAKCKKYPVKAFSYGMNILK